MKKLYLLLAVLFIGGNALASGLEFNSRYGGAFIFVERGVEFAVYPDGAFDFTYNISNGFNSRSVRGHSDLTFNSGYNYNPFVQYDDYGAVVQIKNVPVFYDYYGRIIRAGKIFISYNHFGKISRLGNMHVFYNPYQEITGTSGFINVANSRYSFKPWHRFYRRPQGQHVIVYHQPYRAYYSPMRRNYSSFRKFYREPAGNFFRPGDQITSYHQGRRTASERDLSEMTRDGRKDEIRSNISSERRRNDNTTGQSRIRSSQTSPSRSVAPRNLERTQPSVETKSPAREVREVRRTIRTRSPQESRSSQADPTPVRRSEARTAIPERAGGRNSRGRE